MASRREEKERLRQIREEAEQREASEQRRKLILGYAAAGVLAAAVVAGLVAVLLSSGGGGASGNAHIVSSQFTTTQNLEPDEREGTPTEPGPLASAAKLPQAAKAAGCVLRNPPDEGNTHLASGSPTPDYKSNPPTSGNHDPIPLSNGEYRSPLTDFRHAVHTLEHGRIEVQYKPSLPEAEQLDIKGVVDEDFRNVLLFQNPKMPYEVAATAWDHLLGCKSYNPKALDAIRAFRDAYRDRGPEPASIQPS